jgi:hypothetical protein
MDCVSPYARDRAIFMQAAAWRSATHGRGRGRTPAAGSAAAVAPTTLRTLLASCEWAFGHSPRFALPCTGKQTRDRAEHDRRSHCPTPCLSLCCVEEPAIDDPTLVAGGTVRMPGENFSHIEALKNEGNEFFRVGQYEDAIAAYTAVLHNEPENSGVYSNRSAAYLKVRTRNHSSNRIFFTTCATMRCLFRSGSPSARWMTRGWPSASAQTGRKRTTATARPASTPAHTNSYHS